MLFPYEDEDFGRFSNLHQCTFKALEYIPVIICWKGFRDDIFIVWPHSIDELDIFFDYMNKVDPAKKIQFTM